MLYRYSRYWDSWDAVLKPPSGGDRTWVVRSLTGPYPGLVRTHGTPPGKGDRVVPELPAEVEAEIRRRHGDETAAKWISC